MAPLLGKTDSNSGQVAGSDWWEKQICTPLIHQAEPPFQKSMSLAVRARGASSGI